MKRLSPLLGFAASAALLLGACSSPSGESSGTGPVASEEFVSRLAAAVCDNIAPCCATAGHAYDATSCKASGTAALSDEMAEITPAVRYDPVAAGKCIEAVEEASLNCGSVDIDAMPACKLVFSGTLPPGATCTDDLECAVPDGAIAYCDVADDASPGICVMRARGKLGSACGGTCTTDASGTNCSGGSVSGDSTDCYTNDGLHCNGTCQPLVPLGGSCDSFEACEAGWCQAGTCVALPEAGALCAEGFCTKGLSCGSNGRCEALKLAGEACDSKNDCIDAECANGVCAKQSMIRAETCSGTL